MIRVFMGVPSMGERSDHQCYQLREIEKRYAGEVELVYPEQCVHRFGHAFARNEIVEQFLASDCDILWFLDSDIVPPVHVLDLLTVHAERNWLAAGAPYPLWLVPPGQSDLGICIAVYNGSAPAENGNPQGLTLARAPGNGVEWVDGLATGCLFLRRELFAKLEKPYFAFKYKPENQEALEGEDLGFAFKLQKLGVKYLVDHGMICGHSKKVNLLDVNNYAVNFANARLIEFDRQVRSVLEDVKTQAYQKGQQDALRSLGVIPRQPSQVSKSGIITAT